MPKTSAYSLTAALFIIIFGLSQTSALRAEQLSDIHKAEKVLNLSVERYGDIHTYSSIIVIQERLDGKLREKEYIKTLFAKPRNVYLEWIKPYNGLKTAYVSSRDGKDRFQIKEAGFIGIFGVFDWSNDSVLLDTFYPHRFYPTEANLSYLFDLSLKTWDRAKKTGKLKIREIAPIDDPTLGAKALKVDVEFSPDPADGMIFGRVIFYYDKNTGLPLHFDLFEHDGSLWGKYVFTKFKPNIEIDPKIFDLRSK